MVDKNKVKLGIAPIGWTNDDLPELGSENTFAQCVSEMALAGFTGTEIGNKYPRDTAVLKKELDMRGIGICNGWFSMYFTTEPEEKTIAAFKEHMNFLHAMGAKVIGCSEQGRGIQGTDKPIFGPDKPVFDDKEWRKLANGMDKLAEIAGEKGMKVSMHHHMGTGIQTPEEIDRFMSEVGKNVYLLYDSGHIYFSEGSQEDTDRLIDKYIDRIAHIHLKDIRPGMREKVQSEKMFFLDAVRAGTFTVPGDGIINFDHIFQVVEQSGYEGFMLVEAEQDPAKANPLEYALKARSFIREKTGL